MNINSYKSGGISATLKTVPRERMFGAALAQVTILLR